MEDPKIELEGLLHSLINSLDVRVSHEPTSNAGFKWEELFEEAQGGGIRNFELCTDGSICDKTDGWFECDVKEMYEEKFECRTEGRKMYPGTLRSKESYISHMKNEILMAYRHTRAVAGCQM